MCVSPIRIKNPKINWSEGDSKYLMVPCGKCAECRARKQQDWFVRGTYEYLQLKEHGGNVFAACLTYDNRYLPHFIDDRDYQLKTTTDGYITKVKCPVHYEFDGFDQDALTKFMKRFRIRFQRKYHFNPEGIKFFIACEFGEHTHRPHYHILVYIPISSIHDGEFFDLVDNTWDYGFVSKDKKQTWKVKSLSAIQYATKYVSKDIYFMNKYIEEYLDKEYLDPVEYEYRYNKVKNFLPKFRTSQGFGMKLKDDILEKKNPLEYILKDRPIEFPNRNGIVKNYAIPKYILNSLIKDKDESVSELLGRPYFRYNELGKEYISERFKQRLEKQSIELVEYGNKEYLSAQLPTSELNLDNYEREYLVETISSMVSSMDIEDFTIYRNFLRYLPVGDLGHHKPNWYFSRVEQLVNRFYTENCPFELYSIIRDMNEDITKYHYDKDAELGLSLKDMDEVDVSSIELFCDLKVFNKFEHLCQLMDRFDSLVSIGRCEARQMKSDKINRVRAAFSQYQDYGTVKDIQ